MTDIIKSIKAINPDAQCSVNADDINQITWLNDTPVISNEDILAKQVELKAAYDAKAYARARDEQYPLLKDFAEAYTEKEILADTTKWDDYVIKYNKVRTDNPK
jgi:hypothetical protein